MAISHLQRPLRPNLLLHLTHTIPTLIISCICDNWNPKREKKKYSLFSVEVVESPPLTQRWKKKKGKVLKVPYKCLQHCYPNNSSQCSIANIYIYIYIYYFKGSHVGTDPSGSPRGPTAPLGPNLFF